ncbi:phosphodiesterase [Halomonas sp. SSL-5]|uniref:phosphodiesterase n=1 Tax=Halomonas sp. SSL-5 TaxID=3065855 RepID=UPI002738AA69|nr:phosphodiesterase [Halomonas sp. SSL-5]MDY7115635.1 phosphodiesterase [Halomonas sp. SSL-5]
MPRLIQISDCHLHADPEARGRRGVPLRQLEAVVSAVNHQRPDLVLVTGDISNDDTPASYALARRTLDALEAPWEWLPGNHDVIEPMAATRPLPAELTLGTWRLLLLDTHLPGEPHGELGEAALEALARRLADDPAGPVLIAMHHPPLAVGSAWLDAIGLRHAEAFWQTLAPFAGVRAILCGHIHQAFVGRRAGEEGEVMVYGCPSTIDPFLPGSASFAVDPVARPGYRVVDLDGARLATRVERVDIHK